MSTDFIREMVAADVASNRFGRQVATRFPPEPNGFGHIGHVKSICLNFGIKAEFSGRCNLRFDDTNPATEDVKYVEAFKQDLRWLGFEWDEELYASDYFENSRQATFVQHETTCVELIHQRDVVGGDDDRCPGLVELDEQAQQPLRQIGIDIAGRLVREQKLRPRDHGARDRRTLLFSA